MQFWFGLLLGLPLGALLLVLVVYWWVAIQQIAPSDEASLWDDEEQPSSPGSPNPK